LLPSGGLGSGLWRANSGGAPALVLPLGLTGAGVIVKIGDPVINSAGQIAFWAKTKDFGLVGSGLWLFDGDFATKSYDHNFGWWFRQPTKVRADLWDSINWRSPMMESFRSRRSIDR
jgi:hypothetical protein